MESPISAACRWNAMDWSDGCPVSPRRQRGPRQRSRWNMKQGTAPFSLPDFKGALPALSHRRYASVWRSGGAGRLGDARCPAGRSPLFPLPAAVVSTGGASGLSRARSVRQGWTARTVAGGCGVCDVGYWKKSYLVMEKCTSPGGCRMAADVLYCNHKVQYRKGIGAFHGNR